VTPVENQSDSDATGLRLAVVIINYRSYDLLMDCLGSLEGELEPGRDMVVVVDNASGDGSADQIAQVLSERRWGSWVQLERSEINGGFAYGNNVGIKAVSADHYLLLNSDTLVRPGAIEKLLKAMGDRSEAGIVSPRLEWPDGGAQSSCFYYQSPIKELLSAAATGPVSKLFGNRDHALAIRDEPMLTPWTSFACVMIRKQVIDQVGLLDEDYFMYYEDDDYCRRTTGAGWDILNWPDAHVVHLRGGSGPVKKLTAQRKRRPKYLYASRARYFAKFYGRPGLWAANLLWHLGRVIALARELIGHKKPHACKMQWRDIWINGWDPLKRPMIPGVDPS